MSSLVHLHEVRNIYLPLVVHSEEEGAYERTCSVRA